MKTTAIWVLPGLLGIGCGAERSPVACADYAAAGIVVSVENAATGQAICDAAVTATEGAYTEHLFGVACSFSGAYERPGTYVIRATRSGFAAGELAEVGVVMDGGECPHVRQTRVSVRLTPEG